VAVRSEVVMVRYEYEIQACDAPLLAGGKANCSIDWEQNRSGP
jgi:hypothetical protein